jgi:Domain of unknown function (DUF4157)
MRPSPAAHAELESFFREHLQDGALRLPPINFRSGALARLLTGLGRVQAVTLGSRVFVAPGSLRRDAAGAWRLPARLTAHEAAHVLQYRREGAARFLFNYLREYFRGLRRAGRLNAPGRVRAYLKISYEREARAAEDAFARWRRNGR